MLMPALLSPKFDISPAGSAIMPMPARALPSRHGRTLAPRSFTPVLLEHRNTRPIPHAPFAPDRKRGVMSLACDGHVATPLRADRGPVVPSTNKPVAPPYAVARPGRGRAIDGVQPFVS
jgi:hypothetical protein